ncbi:hypothetical protein [Rhodoferax sp.]|uniref:hypothetical protein n=1 Tax=Rhodoferax sp. TaxID=50421 RepID=UPI002603C894|nr:hypothetical protein [Rhodoferax sp.]MDD3937605.1 hypothetical protein [Rhodoferax sp.]
MLQHFAQQGKQFDSQTQAIKFRDANSKRITFELRCLKAWPFAAKTERVNVEQRQLFEGTLTTDQDNLNISSLQVGSPVRSHVVIGI